MTAVVVYGPQGCGKTRNSEMIRKTLGMTRIVEEWNGVTKLEHGDLALTSHEPPFEYPAISFHQIMGVIPLW